MQLQKGKHLRFKYYQQEANVKRDIHDSSKNSVKTDYNSLTTDD